MFKFFAPRLIIPFLLVSCQKKAEVAPVSDGQSEEEIAALEEKLQRLEENLIAEQNLRFKQDAEQTSVLYELRDLVKKLGEERVSTGPAVVKPLGKPDQAEEKRDPNIETRRVARLKAQGEEHEILVTNTGDPFHDIVISRVTDIGVTFRHKGGIARVSFQDLPVPWQDRFYYDRELALKAQKDEDLNRLRYNKVVRDQMIAMKEEDEMKRQDISLKRLARAVEDLNKPNLVPAPPAVKGQIVVNRPIIVHKERSINDDVYCPPIIRPTVVRTPNSSIPLIRGGNGGSVRRPTPPPVSRSTPAPALRPASTVVRPSSRTTTSQPAAQRSRPTRSAVQLSRPSPTPQRRPSTPRPMNRRSR